jgi:putative membrane protein
MKFLIKLLLSSVVVFALSSILKGVHIDSFWTAFVFSLVLAILNATVRPILVFFTLPATVFTLGLFLFVINALVVWMASGLVEGIKMDGFGTVLIFSFLYSIAGSVLNAYLREEN